MREIFLQFIGALAALFMVSGTQAAVIVTAVEAGGDVVFSTSDGSSLDLTGLTQEQFSSTQGFVAPSWSSFAVGPAPGSVSADRYSGVLSGPDNFGPGGPFPNRDPNFASNGTGDILALNSSLDLLIPRFYVSGSALNSSSTYSNHNFDTLGMAPGSYVWTLPADTLTLNVVAAVPIPATVWLFGSALGFLGWMRRRAS